MARHRTHSDLVEARKGLVCSIFVKMAAKTNALRQVIRECAPLRPKESSVTSGLPTIGKGV